ncbi:MAG: PAS domain S-box protein [Phycisphaerales bacterium]|nr:PAS domain S-box protein [Phycisphaerales bacterium]
MADHAGSSGAWASSASQRERWWQSPGGIAALYLAASVTWILTSDRVVAAMFGDGAAAHLAQTLKGIGWLTGTSVALYFLIRSGSRAAQAAAERASHTEGLLREMGSTVEDVFWVMRVNPKEMLYVSPSFERMWRMPTEELEAHPWAWLDAIVEEDRAAALERFEASVNAPTPEMFESEYRLRRPDGQIVWVRDRGYPVVDASGRVVRVAGLAEDITERKNAETKLLERDLLLRKLSEQVPGVIYQFRMWPDGRSCFPYASEGIRAVYGVAPEEVREDASTVFARLHPDDYDMILESVLRSRDTLEPWNCEYRVTLPDRGERWLEGHSVPERLEDGSTLWHGYIWDVTDRRNAAEALRASDQRFRTLIETTGNAFLMIDGEGRVEEADERYLRLIGAESEAEVLGRKVTEWTAPYDLERNGVEVAHCMASGVVRSLEVDYVRRDGTIQPVEINAAVVETERGPRILGQCRDISQRKRGERELREASERLRAILDNSPHVAIQGYEPDGRVAFWNKASEALYGWSAQQMAGQRLGGRAMSVEDGEEFESMVTRALERGQPASVREWRMVTPTGRTRWCLSSIFPIHFGEGRSLVICMDVDITSRREVESALRESEQRFRQLTEAVREVFWLVDWKARRMLHLSSSFESVWGIPRSSVYADPMAWAAAVHAEDRERVVASFRKDAPVGRYDIEYRLVRPDGALRWVHDRAFPILNERGEVWRVAGVTEDVTERKLAEHRQSLLMQELDHRVKNNLAAALSLADMTARHADSLEEFQEVFTGRLAALARMHALLALTRWSGVRCGELVRRTLEPFLGRGGGEVTIDGPDGMLSAQAASPICMALHELTTNAAKHGALGRKGGRVEVRWEMDGPLGAPERLRLWWTERGGPPVVQPEKNGFGTTLIKGAIEYQLDGKLEMRHDPEGFSCRIEVDFARTAEPKGRWRDDAAEAETEARADR